MTNEIKLFNNDVLNVNIKTVTDDDNNIWFKAKDIAAYFGYNDTDKAIRMHIDDEYNMKYGNLMNCTGPADLAGPTFNEKIPFT